MKQTTTLIKYVIRNKITKEFTRCINDDYCCCKVILVKDLNSATLYDKFFDNEVLNKVLSHAIDYEPIRKQFESIPVKITYEYDE
jgi:hypothetical protein